jgi:hypothetical protein
LRRSGAQRLIGVDAWLIWYLASDEALLGHKLQTQVAPPWALGRKGAGTVEVWMKPRLSDMEWVAFALISRFRAPILDTIPTGSFLALRQTFSWCYMPSPID